MIAITTFEGTEWNFKIGSCYSRDSEDIRFLEHRVEMLYYEGVNRCGVQYLGYDEFRCLHPYDQYYNQLKELDKETYTAKKKVIIEED